MIPFLKGILSRKGIFWMVVTATSILFYFLLPSTLFLRPTSTVLYDKDGKLLSAIIAEDGQWRFPPRPSVPQKFELALLKYEDQHFYEHNGVYLPSVIRAIEQNVTRQKVISGASTLTMQVVRLSRNNPGRTISEKFLEMFRALRLETSYSKKEIIALYASNAPYGGNVVGLDAAAWRYFGRTPEQLSWAESATLAVLPNAPSLIFPGKNQELLLQKRNKLLYKLHTEGHFDAATLELSYLEPLPQKPFALPQTAMHLLNTMCKKYGKGKRYTTTIDENIQSQCLEIVARHTNQLEANLVHNIAVVVINVRDGSSVAYVGNSMDRGNRYGNMVDIVQAPRSTGSILKPFLYAAMLNDGLILPNTLMADIPIQFDGFTPQNYTESFDGAVPASLALSRSLNVPAVVMLKEYGYPRFFHLLQKMNFTHFKFPADHYGLSLILGGGEASLWDITHAYAGMSRMLIDYHDSNGKYFAGNYDQKPFRIDQLINPDKEKSKDDFPLLDAGSVWATYKSLLEVNRPETELGWEVYNSSSPIAWKTGTSFGNRDAWAVGTTPEYVVGVWVGNADGQGKPQLTGVTSAAPILFDVFGILPHRSWFNVPFDALTKIPVCHQSGMRAGVNCGEIDSVYVPLAGLRSGPCKFHQSIHTDATGAFRLSMDCASESELHEKNWFVLPPVQEYYYKSKHPEYASLPPFAEGCGGNQNLRIGLIYPKSDAPVYIPKNLGEAFEKVVLHATHSSSEAVIFWHLDNEYLGETKTLHKLEIMPSPGKHILTLMDQEGNSLVREIEVLRK
jgi:penicillin-binding protein 1C